MIEKNTGQNKNEPSRLSPDEFIHLLTVHQRKIYAYILKLVLNGHDADDLLQETTSVMWKKINTFIPGSNFLAWALRIAHFNILRYRARKPLLILDDEVFDGLHKLEFRQSDLTQNYLSYLQDCLKKMTDQDYQMVTLRYINNLKVKQIAELTNRTTQSLYRTIGRIHSNLLHCVRHKMATEK